MPETIIANDVHVGRDVTIRAFCNLYGCEIGADTQVGAFVEIQRGARVGERCKIQSHSFICSGVIIGDEVFVGHNVTFINDRYPRATTPGGTKQRELDWEEIPTTVRRRASLGSSSTILCGVTIGEGAIVGAGSVVTHDVPAWTVVAGNPARVLRRVEAPAYACPVS